MRDALRLDDPMGPEFSVRIMSVMKMQGIETVGQLRQHLDQLDKWRGLGHKSVKEVRDFYRRLDEPTLMDDPEYRRYKLEDCIGTVEALMHDVQRSMTRVALKGHVNPDTRKQMSLKLRDAAEKIMQLPSTGD